MKELTLFINDKCLAECQILSSIQGGRSGGRGEGIIIRATIVIIVLIMIILATNISPLLDIGLHEGRALFAAFISLNPLTRPVTLTKTGVWSSFTQSCSLYPGITIKKKEEEEKGVLRGSQA